MSQVFISGQQSLHLMLVGVKIQTRKQKNPPKQLKMRSECQKDLFGQCFCPKTDHSYARTALSALSLIMLHILIRGTLYIDRRTHAGRTHTDAEI